MGRKPARSRPLAQALRAFLPFVRPHWRGFVPAVAGVVATSLLGLLTPWPLKFLIDDVLKVGVPGERFDLSALVVLAIAGALVVIAFAQGLFSFVKELFLSATGQRVAFGLRRALFSHLQRLSLRFHDEKRTGDLVTRVTSDVSRIEELVSNSLLVEGVTSLLQSVGMAVVMLVVDRPLGLVACVLAPPTIAIGARYRTRLRAEAYMVREKEGLIASLTQEAMSSIRVVKAFRREAFESKRFETHTGEMLEASIRLERLEAGFSWTMSVVRATSLAALVLVGAYRVAAGALSTGTLVVFIQYMSSLQTPLMNLSQLSLQFAKVRFRAERIIEVLQERPTVEDRPDAAAAPRFKGRIDIERVSFGYIPEQLVLRDVTITANPGEVVAIVGRTGSGKSTLASLILRLYDPIEGSVRIDGGDIRTYQLDSVASQISIVLQESLLFQASIRENIAYGKPEASVKEIEEAARIAYCDEFVDKLPNGLDTVVGERGTTLSGGQRQRIAIARAVIRDAPILILDEPTTGLDSEAEAIVLHALERLMAGRTTLMIAHKRSGVERADRVYVLADGQVAEEGTSEELADKGGLYARLFPPSKSSTHPTSPPHPRTSASPAMTPSAYRKNHDPSETEIPR
ncbi:MAG: ABC transporter ATP-binding protein [Egibacteraceae bacterium]